MKFRVGHRFGHRVGSGPGHDGLAQVLFTPSWKCGVFAMIRQQVKDRSRYTKSFRSSGNYVSVQHKKNYDLQYMVPS